MEKLNLLYDGETNEELLFHQVSGEMVSEVSWKRNVDISFSTIRTINLIYLLTRKIHLVFKTITSQTKGGEVTSELSIEFLKV